MAPSTLRTGSVRVILQLLVLGLHMSSCFVIKPALITEKGRLGFDCKVMGPRCVVAFPLPRRDTSRLSAIKVFVHIVGRKSSEAWIEDGCEMYRKRLRSANVEIETFWHKTYEALARGIDADRAKGMQLLLLDPGGKTMSSEEFADMFYHSADEGGSRMAFVIGGADGLPEALRSGQQREVLVSMSKLTFTHQLARLILFEQIYRSSEIRKGSCYHK